MVTPRASALLRWMTRSNFAGCSMGRSPGLAPRWKPAAWRMLLAMSPSDDLRHAIREKILAGVLPKVHCRMTWYGPGTGGICVACERPIAASDVEVECDLPGGGTIRLHRKCYDVWSKEWPTCDV
jgi:hypothetical protein